MKDEEKSKEQLINELHELREQIAGLRQCGHGSDRAEGRARRLTGIHVDITGRKKAEEVLRESERKFKAVSDSAQDAIIILDAEGAITFWNSAAERVFGYGAAEVMGQNAHLLLAPQRYLEAHFAAFSEFKRTGRGRAVGETLELSAHRKNGEEFPIELSLSSFQINGQWHAAGIVRDISDRKRSEAALRESRERLILALQSSQAGTWDRDLLLDKAIWDDSNHALYGLAPGTFPGKQEDFLGMIHPDDRQRVKDEMTLAIREHVEFSPSYRVIRPDSTVRFLATRGKVFCDNEGRAVRMIGISWDITDLHQATEALKKSEERYRLIFDHAPLGIIHFDQDGIVKDCNDKFAEIVGARKEDILGFNMLERLHDMAFRKAVKGAIEGDLEHYEGNYTSILSGKTTPLRAVYKRITSQDGKFLGAVGLFEDITERKLSEEALRESEERFRRFADDVTSEGIIVHDQGVILDVNARYAAMYGYDRRELIGMDHFKTLDPSYHEVVRTKIRADEHVPYEAMGLRKDGSVFPIGICATDIPFRGKMVRAAAVRDLTEQKRTEEELVSATQRLADIIEFLPDATFVIDNDKKVIAWNRAIEEMTGVSKKDILGKGNYEYAIPFYGERRLQLLDLLDEYDEELASKYQSLRKIGDVLYSETFTPCLYGGKGAHVFATAAPLFDVHGNRAGAIESIRDITSRKEAENALEESRRRLADIIDFLPDATLVIDRKGVVIAWNRAMEAMTGVEAADILGKGDYEYSLPFYGERRPILIDLVLDSREEIETRYIKAKRKGAVLEGEAYTTALKGVGAYLFGTASVLLDSKGDAVGAIESVRDITERRRVEESLARAEEKYRSIFENALEGIYQVTTEGKILSSNPALAQILGYDSPEDLMEAVTDIAEQLYVDPGRRAELLRLIEERGEAKGFEARFYRKDKSVAWVSINVRSVRDESGKTAYLEGILQDITERKTMESRFLQSQKMEAVGKLAGGIAHDFNNILAAIIGYTEIAHGKLLQRELDRYLREVLNAADRAKNLVAQILAFSRKAEKEIKPVDISSLIAESLRLLRAAIPSTIEIRREISPSVGEVLADPTQLHQVMMNLFTNAAYAMRDNGGILEVGLSSTDITPDILPLFPDLKPGPHVKLKVSDTGAGIAPDILSKIFDPFFTTKKAGEGTGLGLSVVYGIVKECGGTVTVLSEPGRGSTFTVYLPAIEHSAEAANEPAGPVPKGKGRIIFVDDEEALVRIGKEMLQGLGYEVIGVPSSLGALELFRAQPDQFDLVITDMTMPGMTGKELATNLLKIRPDIPIILCTGFSEIITEDEAKSIGIREFTTKPFNLRSIAGLVRKALERK